MTNAEPATFSVITVVRNMESVVGECIRSVLAQKCANLEYIIIDGQSTDRTLEVVAQFGCAVTKIISEPDEGLYDAMNKGLSIATGKYVHFLNADDRYFDDQVLSSVLPALEESTVTYGKMLYVESDGSQKMVGDEFSWRNELKGSHVPQMALFVPKACFEIVGGFDTSLKIAADYDMVLRLASRFPMKHLPFPISVMHAGGISYRSPELAFRESMYVARKHGRGRVASYIDYVVKCGKWMTSRALPRRVVEGLRKFSPRRIS
jgi:glycosyltransferase involved in cell wall biosynthesis